MTQNMMRAVQFHTYGGPEQLIVERVPRPEPQAGEVLVRVYAAGVNPIDWKVRKGLFKDVMPLASRLFSKDRQCMDEGEGARTRSTQLPLSIRSCTSRARSALTKLPQYQ